MVKSLKNPIKTPENSRFSSVLGGFTDFSVAVCKVSKNSQLRGFRIVSRASDGALGNSQRLVRGIMEKNRVRS